MSTLRAAPLWQPPDRSTWPTPNCPAVADRVRHRVAVTAHLVTPSPDPGGVAASPAGTRAADQEGAGQRRPGSSGDRGLVCRVQAGGAAVDLAGGPAPSLRGLAEPPLCSATVWCGATFARVHARSLRHWGA